MGGAQETEIVRVGAAAERVRDDVIHLEQMPGAATAPAVPVHIAAAAPVALPHLPLDCRRDGAAPYRGLRGCSRGLTFAGSIPTSAPKFRPRRLPARRSAGRPRCPAGLRPSAPKLRAALGPCGVRLACRASRMRVFSLR